MMKMRFFVFGEKGFPFFKGEALSLLSFEKIAMGTS